MILRMWRGVVKSEQREAYIEYQKQVGPPGYREVSGHVATYMVGREIGDNYELSFLTLWESWDAIYSFSGDPVDKAKYYDHDFEYLIDPPETVEHYEVLATENLPSGSQEGSQKSMRLWKGRVRPGSREEAVKHECDIGVSGYRSVDGNIGIYVIGRDVGGLYEIGMLTLWDSLEAITAFAGDDIAKANYDEYRRCKLNYLVEQPDRVEIFEVIVSDQ